MFLMLYLMQNNVLIFNPRKKYDMIYRSNWSSTVWLPPSLSPVFFRCRKCAWCSLFKNSIWFKNKYSMYSQIDNMSLFQPCTTISNANTFKSANLFIFEYQKNTVRRLLSSQSVWHIILVFFFSQRMWDKKE